ncbi:major facilitator superfamily domain-containing protein, partial [Mycena leptocephala]
VDFEEGDVRNPVCFPRSKKWAITLMACYPTLIASSTGSAYNLGFPSMMRDLNCTEFQATVGFIAFPLGYGVVPLLSSSFSEDFGRQPLYIGSLIGFTSMYLLIALSRDIQTVIIARFVQGSFGAPYVTMVGGTVAVYIFALRRGFPVAIFSAAAVGGLALGPLAAGWVEMNPKMEWRWIQWIQMMCVSSPGLETRSSILLTRLAKCIRKETGDRRYRARIEDERTSLASRISISCTRPIHLLFTEPVV